MKLIKQCGPARNQLRSGSQRRSRRWHGHLSAVVAVAVAITVATPLGILVAAPEPGAGTEKHSESAAPASGKFKGHLPITELTEDQAILHALNRLSYGPRPGDIERIRQIGLEKWIDQQLHPDSIDDSALEKRLEKYPTLKKSSTELLAEFPPPNQAAKAAGETKEEYRQQLQQKRKTAMAQTTATGDDNMDRAQANLAKMQGPGRIIAELSMGKLDRAIYSNRQLEAVMEDFWFNHFNVFANKGADRWLLTSYVRDTIRPHTMGKFQDLLVATAKSPAMLFFLDNWLSVDPAAFQRHQEEIAMRRARFQGRFGTDFPFPQAADANDKKNNQDRGLNENYGREVMELHTVGVDAGYTQQDVIEMARMPYRLDRQPAPPQSRICLQARISRRRQKSCDGPHL